MPATASRTMRLTYTATPVAGVPVTHEVLADATSFSDYMADSIDAAQHPWKRADRNPFPTMHPFPLLDRLTAAATEAHDRIAAAWDTLRHGTPYRDDPQSYDTW